MAQVPFGGAGVCHALEHQVFGFQAGDQGEAVGPHLGQAFPQLGRATTDHPMTGTCRDLSLRLVEAHWRWESPGDLWVQWATPH